jgi:hypothetical protein
MYFPPIELSFSVMTELSDPITVCNKQKQQTLPKRFPPRSALHLPSSGLHPQRSNLLLSPSYTLVGIAEKIMHIPGA